MTTRITTPADEDAYPTEQPQFDNRNAGRPDGAPMMFSPTSSAAAGQFDTEADQQR